MNPPATDLLGQAVALTGQCKLLDAASAAETSDVAMIPVLPAILMNRLAAIDGPDLMPDQHEPEPTIRTIDPPNLVTLLWRRPG